MEQEMEHTIEPARKKLADMSEIERREYDKNAKQRSRARRKLVTQQFSASEWAEQFPIKYPAHESELDQYAAEFAQTVLSELQIESSHADVCLDQIARTLLGIKNNWVRDVQPSGQLIAGMYFADALGETIIYETHLFELEKSPTFSAAYRELLTILDRRYGHENTKHAVAIKQELSGEYVLVIPLKPEPTPEPLPVPEPPKLPSDREILERGRIQLLNQLPPDARQFLYGGVR